VDTRPNSTGELTYGTITHTFADSDTSAQLLVDLRSDSAGSGYRLDNILFEGTPDPNVPTFSTDPLSTSDARATVAYSDSISGSAPDPDGDPVTYTKISGPTWLTIAANGDLSGTPGHVDVGLNRFQVLASDGNGGLDTGTLEIQVNDPDGNPPYEPALSNTTQHRLVWLEDPSSTMTVAWKQSSGDPATVHYGKVDYGRYADFYPNSRTVDQSRTYQNAITTQFVNLSGLEPDTAYYFVLKDGAGVSERYWFKTAPATPKPFSFIAGGDSRNNKTPRVSANRMVAKLRPLFVAFTGDMIDKDNGSEWNEWLNDWEHTTSADGRMYPILAHRGNHEGNGNSTLVDLFNVPSGNYYALSFGGDLLRYYVLNSESGESTQATWLQNDLDAAGGKDAFTHLMAGYHKPMRPHQRGKAEGSAEYSAWAELFYSNRFDLIFESDSHCMKRTYPIRPSVDTGSEEGFITDIANGTVYVGEGCWGAPLRSADDNKAWTKASGRFNGFDLVHVFLDHVEVFTVQVDLEAQIGDVTEDDSLSLPTNLKIWQPSGEARLVVNRGATPKTSFAGYQLDTFGTNLPANSGKREDFDSDGYSNFMEFAFGMDATANTRTSYPNFPSFAIEEGAKKLVHQRRSNTTARFTYSISDDLSTWTPLEEGVDYTMTVTPGAGIDAVEIELIGDAANREKSFLRVEAGE
ncbi:MAG: fibronectin type III domain-containing protein, partial [Akkermansiaceae bacterium]|nr:fibronectin type III domain-containing protein [Akkermansiaceae bacterium]